MKNWKKKLKKSTNWFELKWKVQIDSQYCPYLISKWSNLIIVSLFFSSSGCSTTAQPTTGPTATATTTEPATATASSSATSVEAAEPGYPGGPAAERHRQSAAVGRSPAQRGPTAEPWAAHPSTADILSEPATSAAATSPANTSAKATVAAPNQTVPAAGEYFSFEFNWWTY